MEMVKIGVQEKIDTNKTLINHFKMSTFSVECVTNTFDLSEAHITEARKICEAQNVHFSHRFYNALVKNDRKYIKNIPAYHILKNNKHITTVYPSDNLSTTLSIVQAQKSFYESFIQKFYRKKPLSSHRHHKN